MATAKKTEVKVRCFCGRPMTVNPRARKAVICDRCQQPLPMKAIRKAVAWRG